MKHLRILCATGLLPACVFAQAVSPDVPATVPPKSSVTAPLPAEKPGSNPADVKEDEVIELSPFTVTSDEETGYFTDKGLSSGRLGTELKDSAASVNVFTKDLANDIGAIDIGALIDFGTNTQLDNGDFEGSNIATVAVEGVGRANILGRARGLSTARLIDYEQADWEIDNYNIERTESFLGADAILFGNGSAGGVFNSTRDRARTNGKNRGTVTVGFGSDSFRRFTFDYNLVIVPRKFAVRIGLVDFNSAGARVHNFRIRQAKSLAATFEPIRGTAFFFSYDSGRVSRQQEFVPGNGFPTNALTNWINSTNPAKIIVPGTGVSAGTPPIVPIPTPTGAGLSGTTNPATGDFFGDPATGATANYFVGGRSNIPSPSPYGTFAGSAASPYAYVLTTGAGNIPTSTVYDYDRYSFSGPDSRYFQQYSDIRFTFEQRILKDLNFFAYYRKAETDQNSRFFRRNGIAPTLYADPYRDPANPDDPLTGSLYGSGQWRFQTAGADRHAYVARLAYAPNFGPYLGRHRLSLGFEKREDEFLSKTYQDSVYTLDAAGTGIYSRPLRRLNYFDPADDSTWHAGYYRPIAPFTHPITGRQYYAGFVPQSSDGPSAGSSQFKRDSYISHLESYWLKGRIVTGVGYRKDENKRKSYLLDYTISEPGTVEPPITNVLNGFFTHTGRDYFGTRTLSNQSDPTQTAKSYSIVVHIDQAKNYSLFYGNSQNSQDASDQRVLPDGIPSQSAATANAKEYGIRLSFLNDKISVRLAKFETKESNKYAQVNNVWNTITRRGGAAFNNPNFGASIPDFFVPLADGTFFTETPNAINNGGSIAVLDEWLAQISDPVSTNGKPISAEEKARYERVLGINPNSSSPEKNLGAALVNTDGGAKGHEFRVNLRPTKNLSVLLNYSSTTLFKEGVAQDFTDWLEQFYGLVQDLPASVLNAPYNLLGNRTTRVQSNGLTYSIPVFGTAPNSRPAGYAPTNGQVYEAIFDGITRLVDEYAEESEAGFGNRKHSFNVFTRYDFQTGFLKGFAAGGGYTYRSDTTVARLRELDPTTKHLVVKNLKANAVWDAQAFISYKFKPTLFGARRNVTMALNINHLFQDKLERDILRYQISTLRILGEGTQRTLTLDSTGQPIPTNWSYSYPREYRFTTTVNF